MRCRLATEPWDCGALALYHLLHLTGRSPDLDRLRSVLGAPGPSGHSFRELRQAAARFGLSLDAVVLPKQRPAFQGPVLLFVKMGKEGHFLVVRPVGHTGHLVQVLNGERPPDVIDAERLFASPAWTGLALVPHRPNYIAIGAVGLGLACKAALACRFWTRHHGRFPRDERGEAADSGGG